MSQIGAGQIIESDLKRIHQQVDMSCFRAKRILVAGGAGFLGTWLCDLLVLSGAFVECVDNLSTGLFDNIRHLIGHRDFTFTESDVTQTEFEDKRYDLIFHLASRASPEEYQQYPVQTLLANSSGTWNLLELAKRSHATTVYASSSEVYGDSQVLPTPETYWGWVNPIGVRSCYDEGKRFGEALCMAYKRGNAMDVRIIRIFNTFGPRIREDGAYGRAVSRFISQALKGNDITVYGDGNQTRSFCYVTDTLSGILRVASNETARGEVLNIGNPQETRILEIAQRINKLAGDNSRISYKPLPPDDPVRRCPDISKAKRLLGWEPVIPLDDALKRTVEWFTLRSE